MSAQIHCTVIRYFRVRTQCSPVFKWWSVNNSRNVVTSSEAIRQYRKICV